MKINKSFKSFLIEMSISNVKHIGNWEKNHSFRERDRKMLTNPRNIELIRKKFDNANYDFDFYFVNKQGAGKHREEGEVSLDYVKKSLGEDVAKEIINHSGDNDTITVIFTNNVADKKIPMTPWIIAHRLGHVFARKNGVAEWSNVYHQAERFLLEQTSMIFEYYGRSDYFPRHRRNMMGEREKQLAFRAFFTKIATFRSARKNQIRDWFEVMNELIAQYLTTGKITFNEPPRHFGSKYSGYFNVKDDEDYQDAKDLVEGLARSMEWMIDDILGSCVNKIFIM